jgi:hypothetical protein
MQEGNRDQLASVLELALNIVAGVVEYGFGEGRHVHPALLLLQEIWPSLESLTITWAANGVVATALCNLWGSVANKVGMCISEVLPGVITAASSMFKFHRVAAPLACLSKVCRYNLLSEAYLSNVYIISLGMLVQLMPSFLLEVRTREQNKIGRESMRVVEERLSKDGRVV